MLRYGSELRWLLCLWLPLVLLPAPGDATAFGGSDASPPLQEEEQDKETRTRTKDEDPPESTLGTFEGEAADASGGDDEDDDDGVSVALAQFFFDMSKVVFAYGGMASWYRVHGAPYGENPGAEQYLPRELGEPMLPFVRVDAGYQNVESDVHAARSHLEAGYGPVAAQFRWSHYEEDEPATEMDLFQWYGLYRMSFSQYVEVDLGIGQMILDGERRRSGASVTFPMRIRPTRNLGISFSPSWGQIGDGTLRDVELLLSGGLRYVSVRAGYRWTRAGSASLDGPVIGLSFHL